MINPFETFLSFSDDNLATLAAEKLQKSKIDFFIERSKPLLDESIIGNSIDQNIHIKIRRTDFQSAHKALEDYYQTQLENIDKDYYLLSFSIDELKEIVAKPDEWGHFNYQLAQKLLKEQGLEVDPVTLTRLKEDRIKELAKPEKAS